MENAPVTEVLYEWEKEERLSGIQSSRYKHKQ